jgi:hypothetical protein
MPMDALELQVGIVFLELEFKSLVEIDVGSLNGVHVFFGELELVELKVFRKDLHF